MTNEVGNWVFYYSPSGIKIPSLITKVNYRGKPNLTLFPPGQITYMENVEKRLTENSPGWDYE